MPRVGVLTWKEFERDIGWTNFFVLASSLSLARALKVSGASEESLMAGQVKHTKLFSDIVPDLTAIGLLARIATKNTDSIIGAVGDFLAAVGRPAAADLGASLALLPQTSVDQAAAGG